MELRTLLILRHIHLPSGQIRMNYTAKNFQVILGKHDRKKTHHRKWPFVRCTHTLWPDSYIAPWFLS